MSTHFQRHHAAMLLKYSGISFIAGAVNHGFFSGERSLWTAAIGMGLFIVGAIMEHRLAAENGEHQASGLLRTLVVGALLSIGLGFFTGGLQHFPDSPARSAWVVPLGFAVSVIAFAFDTAHKWKASSLTYSIVVGILITSGSIGAWRWLEHNPEWLGMHAHGHHGPAQSSPDMTALKVDRTIAIRMDDNFRFTPNQISVNAGETIKLVVTNVGKVPHELVLGSEAEIQAHAELMRTSNAHHDHHDGGPAISLAAGASGDLVIKFGKASTVEMACLIPGHYEAGMRGTVKVAMGSNPGPTADHDHSSHKH